MMDCCINATVMKRFCDGDSQSLRMPWFLKLLPGISLRTKLAHLLRTLMAR